MNQLRKLPGVDKLIGSKEIIELINKHGKEIVTHCVRIVLEEFRENIKNGEEAPDAEDIIKTIIKEINSIVKGNLKAVFNCSGIIIHTNLGRAPLGTEAATEVIKLISGYSNLEFSLEKGKRSDRNLHSSKLLKYLTGAQDILVVNNNAAAVILMLSTFAKDREVIVSRGELIEIGGSFRMPDIMATSGCKMVEVGSTNKTRVVDYENAISKETALLFKAHKSNYAIQGFTEEASLNELVALGKKYKIPVIYDMGSGLLKKVGNTALVNEPDVKQALATGIDLVSFSGDKLLGGPQAGIIAGKKSFVQKLKKAPMMRALRVCKLSLAVLENACKNYLDENQLKSKNQVFKILNKTDVELRMLAESIHNKLAENNIPSQIVESTGQYGGGSMPGESIKSYAVVLKSTELSCKQSSDFAVNMFSNLLKAENAVLGILKKGEIHFDVLCLNDDDLQPIAETICEAYNKSGCK